MTVSKFWMACLVVLSLFLISCEDDEQDQLAKAQDCLNKVNDKVAGFQARAAACESHLQGLDSESANIIRCSIKFIEGGLTTSRIVEAHQGLDEAANKELYLISFLGLSSKTTADEAFSVCRKSGAESLIYLSGLSHIGTFLTNGTQLSSAADVQNLKDNCDTKAEAEANCNPDDVVASLEVVSEIYCADKKDDKICEDITAALTAGTAGDKIAEFINGLD